MKKTHNHRLLLLALITAPIVGVLLHAMKASHLTSYILPFGTLFIRCLKLIIVPLVFSSLFCAVLSLGDPEKLGNLGLKAFKFYLATTTLAVFVGILVVNTLRPGVGLHLENFELTRGHEKVSHLIEKPASLFDAVKSVLMDIVPTNAFAAFNSANMLQIIFLSLLFGVVALKLKKQVPQLIALIKEIERISLSLTDLIMKAAPVGIFALLCDVVAQNGMVVFGALGKYVAAVVVGLAIHFSLLTFWGAKASGCKPRDYLSKLSEPLLMAFSTASSAATLPVSLRTVEEKLKVKRSTAEFVLPFGATINMDGTALYESVSVIFIAQIYNIHLTLTQQIIIFITSTLAAIGAAAIPGAGLVTMSIVLSTVGLPLEGIGLVLAVERILDMFRTAVNVYGDCSGAAVVESWLKSSPSSRPFRS